MILLVTGSRRLAGPDADRLVEAINRLDELEGFDPTCPPGVPAVGTIVQGGASGADKIAAQWAASWGRRVVEFQALWARFGPRAGPMRNERMVAWCAERSKAGGDHVVCLVAPGGSGTADCEGRARAAGLQVLTVADALALPAGPEVQR